MLLGPIAGQAASLSDKDVQIVGKALGFLDPPVASGVVAVVFGKGDAASEADAQAIVAAFGSGIKAGGAVVTAKAVDTGALGDGSAYVAIVAAQGGSGEAVMAAVKAHKLLCVTSDLAQVSKGACVMSVHSDPKVEIVVNLAAEAVADVKFAPAFHMMIKEQ